MSTTATLCITLSIARFGMLSKLHALWSLFDVTSAACYNMLPFALEDGI